MQFIERESSERSKWTIRQYVTPYLGRESSKMKFPPNSSIIDDNDDKSLKWFRSLIFNGNEFNPVVLIVYNKNTVSSIDLYIKLRPKFDLVIQTPFVLHNDIETIYDYRLSNNIIFHYDITPIQPELDDQVDLIIENVGNLIDGNIVVLGYRNERQGNNIYYISDLSDAPESAELIIDTMMDENYNYISFAVSLERFFAFNNAIYYRMMNEESVRGLPVTKVTYEYKMILEARDHGRDPLKLFPRKNVEALDFFIKRLYPSKEPQELSEELQELLEIPLNILPSSFLIKWRKKGYNPYVGTLISVLLNNKSYLIELFNFPTRTEDSTYDYIHKKNTYDILKRSFPDGGLMSFLNVFNEFAKNIEGKSIESGANWCNANYIKYYTIYRISKQLNKFGVSFESFNALGEYGRIYEVLKDVYGYTILRKTRGKSLYYDNTSNSYRIDESFTIQNFKELPDNIIPLVVAQVYLGTNIIYLYI